MGAELLQTISDYTRGSFPELFEGGAQNKRPLWGAEVDAETESWLRENDQANLNISIGSNGAVTLQEIEHMSIGDNFALRVAYLERQRRQIEEIEKAKQN